MDTNTYLACSNNASLLGAIKTLQRDTICESICDVYWNRALAGICIVQVCDRTVV